MQDRFIVPQFIDAEDKIFGPITVRQFVIMIIGGLLIFAAYKLSDFALFIVEFIILTFLTILFSFIKINGAPFHIFLLNFIQTSKKPKLRIWVKEDIKTEEYKLAGEDKKDDFVTPKSFLPTSKLSELSLIIDTGGVYKGEQEASRLNKSIYNRTAYEK